jgi:hypothetical protein
MKRFLLFAFNQYYPAGGWSDFEGDFDSAEEADTAGRKLRYDEYEIIDTQTREAVDCRQIPDACRRGCVIKKPLELFSCGHNIPAIAEVSELGSGKPSRFVYLDRAMSFILAPQVNVPKPCPDCEKQAVEVIPDACK